MRKGNSLDPTLAGGEVLSGTGALAPVPYSGFASAYAQPFVQRATASSDCMSRASSTIDAAQTYAACQRTRG